MNQFAKKGVALAAAILTSLSLVSCGNNNAGSDASTSAKPSTATSSAAMDKETKPLDIFATTGYIADAVKNIAPDANITTMVGPGGDPHTYQPTTNDIEKMKSADVVIWSGLHLEAQMLDQLKSLGDKQISVGDMVPEDQLLDWPEEGPNGEKLHDPHIWNNPEAWKMIVGFISDKLSEVQPDNKETFAANAKKYQGEIDAAVAEAEKDLAGIPDANRILVTGHDAFNYFGKRFNLEIHATDFVSSEAQKSPEEIDELATLIAEKKVPVIFLDNLANPQAIKSLQEAVKAKGWDVKVSDEQLYADSLGDADPVDTYIGVLKHNAKAVGEALGK